MRIDSAAPRFVIVLSTVLVAFFAVAALPALAADPEPEPEREDRKTARPPDPGTPDRSASAIVRAAKARGSASEEPVKVYTNDDLDRVWAGSVESKIERRAPASPPKPPPSSADGRPGTDPLQALQQRKARELEGSRRVAEAEAEAARAAERVKAIEERLRLLRNPLLGRAKAPDEPAGEGAREWSALDGAERVKRSEQELLEAREALDSKQKAVEQLRRNP